MVMTSGAGNFISERRYGVHEGASIPTAGVGDFLSENYRSEGTFLDPLGHAGRGYTYPQTEDVPSRLLQEGEGMPVPTYQAGSEGMGGDIGTQILGFGMSLLSGGKIPYPPQTQAPQQLTAQQIAAMQAARKPAIPTWGWLAIAGGGLLVLGMLGVLAFKK